MDRQDAQKTWNVLASAIDEIYNRNASQLSFEELYRNAYNLVLQKHGNLLYEGVSDKINKHLEETARSLGETNEKEVLEAMAVAWDEHKTTLSMCRDILMYMDRTYVVQQKRRPVYDLGLHLFRLTVWDHPKVKPVVINLLLEGIALEREGYQDDPTKYQKIIQMLIELGRADYTSAVYQSDFEAEFLGRTQEFYQNESLQFLSQNAAIDYVRKATARLKEETDRAHILGLPATTEGPLTTIMQTELIERHAKALVEMETSGFAAMLQDESKLEEMRCLYDLFVRVPSSVDHLRDALAARIKIDGGKLIRDQETGNSDPPSFIRGVLRMKAKFDSIVKYSFRDENRAQKRMKESFEDFLNRDARAASCLAIYVDELLRVGFRDASEEQIQRELEQAIVVFRFLSDKDIFEVYYKQHLAKRLLAGKSVSDEAERSMVSLLKSECGYQYTTKLEGMFNDMRISKETREEYKTYKRQQKDDAAKTVEIEVDVLTSGYWPSQNIPSCTLPTEIQNGIDHFSEFYLGKHTGRKLKWQTSTGGADLKACFGSGTDIRRYEFMVSTYQMCILLLFNDVDVLTYEQIRSRTQIPDSELRRHLISLCTPKNRILKKGSKVKSITSDDESFTFNTEYSSKHRRVRIPLVKETSLQSSSSKSASTGGKGSDDSSPDAVGGSVPVAVQEDRRYLTEAVLVRIMKARRTMTHNDLVAEATRQLSIRFTPSPQFIKLRIETLIEREYIERDEKEHRLYTYVA